MVNYWNELPLINTNKQIKLERIVVFMISQLPFIFDYSDLCRPVMCIRTWVIKLVKYD